MPRRHSRSPIWINGVQNQSRTFNEEFYFEGMIDNFSIQCIVFVGPASHMQNHSKQS